MSTLNSAKQRLLVKQLQSNNIQEVSAGITTCQHLDMEHPDGGFGQDKPITELVPALFAALPRTAPCLLRHAHASDAPHSFRFDCLVCVTCFLFSNSPKAACKLLSVSQLESLVSLSADACSWADVATLPGVAMEATRCALVRSVGRLLSTYYATDSVSPSAADAFFKLLLPCALNKDRSGNATVLREALYVACGLLADILQLERDSEGPASVTQIAELLVVVAGWDLPSHIPTVLQAATESASRLPVASQLPVACLQWLDIAFATALSDPAQLSDHEMHVLLAALRSLWQHVGCRQAWIQEVLQKLQAGWYASHGEALLTHVLSLVHHGWLPLDMNAMHARPRSSATDDRSNAEVLVNSLAEHGQHKHTPQDLPGPGIRMLRATDSQGRGINTMSYAGTLAWNWLQALAFVQLGMPHQIATETGVQALLKAGMLKGFTQGLARCWDLNTADRRSGFDLLAGLAAWYAERFPAVRSAMAVEYLATCRRQAQQGQAGAVGTAGGSAASSACVSSSSSGSRSSGSSSSGSSSSGSSSSGSSASSPTFCPPDLSGSLWGMLQHVHDNGLAGAESGGVQAGSSSQKAGGADADADADSAGPVDYSRMSADEFAALPAAQLRRVLEVPSLSVSMGKLQWLVGQQIEVLQAHASARQPPRSTPLLVPAPLAQPPSAVLLHEDHPLSHTLPFPTAAAAESGSAQAATAAIGAGVAGNISARNSTAGCSTAGSGSVAAHTGVSASEASAIVQVSASVPLEAGASSQEHGEAKQHGEPQGERVTPAAGVQGAADAGANDSACRLTHGSRSALPTLPEAPAGSSAAAGSSMQAALWSDVGCSVQAGTAPYAVQAGTAPYAVQAGTALDNMQAGTALDHVPEPRACVVCGVTQRQEGGKLLLCAGCASTRYCSSTCQKQHWKHGGHKAVCKALQATAAAEAEAATVAVAATSSARGASG